MCLRVWGRGFIREIMPEITNLSLDFLDLVSCLFQVEKKNPGYYTFCKLIVVGKENYNYFVWSKSWLIQIQSGKFVLKIKAGSPALAEQDFFGTGTEIKRRSKVILYPYLVACHFFNTVSIRAWLQSINSHPFTTLTWASQDISGYISKLFSWYQWRCVFFSVNKTNTKSGHVSGF